MPEPVTAAPRPEFQSAPALGKSWKSVLDLEATLGAVSNCSPAMPVPLPPLSPNCAAHRAPETAASLAHLGHWYYLAADYEQATQVISEAFEQIPQDGEIQAQLGWALVEQRKFASAIPVRVREAQ